MYNTSSKVSRFFYDDRKPRHKNRYLLGRRECSVYMNSMCLQLHVIKETGKILSEVHNIISKCTDQFALMG